MGAILRAYPRVCGATPTFNEAFVRTVGLSPRVRGNPNASGSFGISSGPIPACAGQPQALNTACAHYWAYPRVCGATTLRNSKPPGHGGLSPRVRGNLTFAKDWRTTRGPIPACAGQPASFTSQMLHAWAYPRVCGATRLLHLTDAPCLGLSPRVRGNLIRARNASCWVGPIPACAGQPEPIAVTRAPIRAYPRVCGATLSALQTKRLAKGLSPRVRGNRFVLSCFVLGFGPIPACAGQPQHPHSGGQTARAYPRVCGATSPLTRECSSGQGLSPRVRGNLLYLTH